LIEVHAASVNPIDNILRAGYLKQFIPLRFPHILGNDVSGVVSAVGANVQGFSVGQAVFARPNAAQSGTFAEYVAVKAADCALKPENLTHAQAASVPLVTLTAWQALIDKAGLKAGQRVLIHAGSGGVGTAGIQIAKHLGAEVISTTSSENVPLVKGLGADEVIDYKTQKFDQLVSGLDVVLDTLGGETQLRSLKVLKKGGFLVTITNAAGDVARLAEEQGVHFQAFFMQASGKQLTQIADLLARGVLKPVIDRSFTLDQIREAMDYSLSGRTKGKIVVTVKG
jgi:NADPH:quinone reductase-like Zn-dependent oxidoreductase